MKNIDLYHLASELHHTSGVRNTAVIAKLCPDATIRVDFDNGLIAFIGPPDGYPDRMSLILDGWYDFSNDDYRKGAETIVADVMR